MGKITFEDLKTYKGFEEIDKKVEFINNNRWVCEEVIRELNRAIDLDYVNQSEKVELNTEHELHGFQLEDRIKVFRSEPMPPFKRMREVKSQEEYKEIITEQRDASSIVIYKENGTVNPDVVMYKPSGHLKALDYALAQAREERKLILQGEKPDMDCDFIEYVNERLISKLLAGGPTAGYGRFRRRVFRYGQIDEMNVRLSGAKFETTPGFLVDEEMHELVKEYNESELHPIAKAIVFKIKFVKIHPFSDFNGRTSRILFNYMLVRYGIPTVTIKGKQREFYISAMEKAITEDDYSDIIELVKKLLNKRCDKYIACIEEAIAEKNKNNDETF